MRLRIEIIEGFSLHHLRCSYSPAQERYGHRPMQHYFFPARQPDAVTPGHQRVRLAQMFRDEFGHLEHAHLALAIKYRLERVVGVDHDSFLFVLQAAPLDVCPKLFCKLRP